MQVRPQLSLRLQHLNSEVLLSHWVSIFMFPRGWILKDHLVLHLTWAAGQTHQRSGLVLLGDTHQITVAAAVQFRPEVFLCGIWMFPLCHRGFSLGTLASSHSPIIGWTLRQLSLMWVSQSHFFTLWRATMLVRSRKKSFRAVLRPVLIKPSTLQHQDNSSFLFASQLKPGCTYHLFLLKEPWVFLREDGSVREFRLKFSAVQLPHNKKHEPTLVFGVSVGTHVVPLPIDSHHSFSRPLNCPRYF